MRSIRFLCVFLFSGIFFSCSTLSPVPPPISPSPTPERQLQNTIDRLLKDSIFIPAHVGLKVLSLTRGDVLYEANAKKLFHPASNTKLFPTALALNTLGKDFVFTTRVYADSLRDSSTIKGNIYLRGSGDPDLTTADLREMVQRIQTRGVRRITGDLVGDIRYFDDVEWGSGWMWDDDPSSDAMHLSPLSVNKNCIVVSVTPNSTAGKPVWVTTLPQTAYVTVQNEGVTGIDTSRTTLECTRPVRPESNTIIIHGSIPRTASVLRKKINVWHPEMYTLTLFKEELEHAGIVLHGTLRLDSIPARSLCLTECSRKLDTVLVAMNNSSDNLAAENILKTISAEKRKERGSTAGGLQELNIWLNAAGIDTACQSLVDGSGLSFYNLVSPETLIRLLDVMYQNKDLGEAFRNTLPIAGESGNLRTRMVETHAEGKVFAKTGTLNGVSALTGYAVTANGEWLAFSMIMEHFLGSARPYRAIQDSLASVLCTFRR